VLLELHYRVLALCEHEAQELLDKRQVELYALLPTMKGVNAVLLSQAIDELKVFYIGQEDRLANHLLWFGTFLQRSEIVSLEDKGRIKEKMEDFDSLLDENPFVQKRRVEGEIKATQKAIITIVRARFPALTELAQQQVTRINNLDTLDFLIEKLSTAPDETTVRFLLSSPAA